MTQYDELKEFIRLNPGASRYDIRRCKPKITHENEILTKLVDNGVVYRERVNHLDKWGRNVETWGYFTIKD